MVDAASGSRHHHRGFRGRLGLVSATALSALALVAAGCSGSGGSSPSSGGSSSTLTVFVHTEPAIDSVLTKMDAAFEAANPGVHVVLSTVPSNNFAADLSSRLAAHAVDVTEGPFLGINATENPSYVTGPESGFVTGVKAGDWLDLTDQPFMKNFEPAVLKDLATNGKNYAVPSGLDYYTGVFYSKAIFEKYHISIPRTWSDFLSVCKTLKSNGVSPLLIGGKDTWPAGLVMQAAVHGLYTPAQQQTVVTDLWNGKNVLTSPNAVEVLNRVKTAYSYVTPNFAGIAYTQVPSLFAGGQAAMVPDGTWDQPTIAQADPNFKFGYFPMPMGDTPASNAYLGGKLDISYSIPSGSKNLKMAEKWLATYASPKWYAQYIAASGFIPVQQNIKATAFVDSLKPYEAPNGFSLAWDQVFFGNTKSGTLSTNPFDYQAVTPMGQYTDMSKLAAAEQDNWNKALKEVSK